jgi:chemotaxis protein MotA
MNSAYSRYRRRSRSTAVQGPVLGSLIAFSFIGFGIALGGDALSFIDIPSLFIVLGGTFGGTLLTYSLDDIRLVVPAVRSSLHPRTGELHLRLDRLVELSQRVKADGTHSLEDQASFEDDPFLRKSLQLLVDNFSEDEFRKSLDIEYRNAGDNFKTAADVLNTMGTIAPSMGLIGTIIGLVHMLHHLNTPDQIGPGMAVALITTLYGAILSFIIFNPLADKLRLSSQDEMKMREMTYEALQLIHQNLHPRLLEQRLSSFVDTQANSHAF